ncbi:MAG: histone deacetylase [Pseudomonadota bacterium]
MNKKIGIIKDDRFFDHKIDIHSHENPQRLRGLYRALSSPEYNGHLKIILPREATEDEVFAVHSKFYVKQIREHSVNHNPYSYDKDTYLMDMTLQTALLGAGGCLELAEQIMHGEIDYGFALTRPPGHHAEAGRGMGFCVLNNAAITAKYLQKQYGLNRILIFDFDIHHCNGTQEIFYESDQVMVFSLHQNKIFPFTGSPQEVGKEAGRGFNINIPVFADFGDVEYTFLSGKILGAVIEQYMPQIILVSAGYDGHKDDSISRTMLTTEWYGKVTEMLKKFSNDSCQNRLLFILEGGYNSISLEHSVLKTIDSLMSNTLALPGIIHSERADKILHDHPTRQFWTL